MSTVEHKWIAASRLKTGDDILLVLSPFRFTRVLGVKNEQGKIHIENTRYGTTTANPKQAIRIICKH